MHVLNIIIVINILKSFWKCFVGLVVTSVNAGPGVSVEQSITENF